MEVNPREGGGSDALVVRAQEGDAEAFRVLVEAHQAELHAHCYRMLASYHDAEDALQDALLRAWQALPRFEGRSSLRAWLYKIATNAALDVAKRRSRRELPVSYGPSVVAGGGLSAPLIEMTWVEPYPDQQLGGGGAPAWPEARYDQHESLELAFVTALQTLPASQRAALLLREVLGFSATEIADQLGTTVPAVTSALQRARQGLARRDAEPDQQRTVRSLGDERVRQLAEAFVDALERADTGADYFLTAELLGRWGDDSSIDGAEMFARFGLPATIS